MKNVVIILFLIALPTFGMAQNNDIATVSNSTENIIDTPKKEVTTAKSEALNAKIKSQLIKVNHKKSNEIISIKAYRKSLHIKVKNIKLC